MNKINPAQREQAQGEQMNNNSNFEVSSHIVIYDSEEDFGDKCTKIMMEATKYYEMEACQYKRDVFEKVQKELTDFLV